MATNSNIPEDLEELRDRFRGDIFLDRPTCVQYATDASVYREIPQAVTRPKDLYDIIELVEFAKKHNASLIPRGAGTSLAGQTVGYGIVVDVGKYMNRILEINEKENWVRVQPGVVLDELNFVLEEKGLFFSPETSTSNRCMIGGMVGNNACGAHSLVYGSTRDHLIAVKAVLSDSSIVEFDPLSREEFNRKLVLKNLEGEIYKHFHSLFSEPVNRQEVYDQFPDRTIKSRNNGYAIDLALDSVPFDNPEKPFNFSNLLAGSEGTLAFFTEFKLHLDPLPPPIKGLVCVHCESLEDALNGNLIALKEKPRAVELIDRTVMELSKQNITQKKNRFFILGDPEAILIVEFAGNSVAQVKSMAAAMEKNMRKAGYGYGFPLLLGDDIPKVWSLRKAGLGLLSNMPGDAKPVPVVEDTAVRVEDLPGYIAEFQKILNEYDLKCAYNAHIGTGELHLRPILDLKKENDIRMFYEIARKTAKLVKKFRGSLSGEHGDGRLRGEFVREMIGMINFEFLSEIKRVWDPENIFNEGKIFNTPPVNTFLRYDKLKGTSEYDTAFDYSPEMGYIRSIEKCNGSGDCRKSEMFGGTMCPSYHATRDENTTTRARANVLREYLSRPLNSNPFDSKEIFDILDLCLSCKGCKSECPSNVDMAKLKAEFLYHYNSIHPVSYRTKTIAHYHKNYRLASRFPGVFNQMVKNRIIAGLFKKALGIAPKRSLPLLYKYTLKKWIQQNHQNGVDLKNRKGSLYFFIDEFTDYNDTQTGIKSIQLLRSLGYDILFKEHAISGRSYISKGFLDKFREVAITNVETFTSDVSESIPVVGIEPSAILTFRDEYPDILRGSQKENAEKLAENVFTIEEFIAREKKNGAISDDFFHQEHREILYHGHCQQKAIASITPVIEMLSLPKNYTVKEIPSGCCGMAGSFGYEKEHFELSMQIGEMILFPEIRKTDEKTFISASGTSCRHQIKDGTGRKAYHPVDILFEALKNKK